MKKDRPAVTIVVHRDGDVTSRSFRVPFWMVRGGLAAAGCLLIATLTGAILYLPIVGVAAQVPGLKSEIATLRGENAQIRRLVNTVDSLEAQYAKVRGMLGADRRDDSSAPSTPLIAPPIVVLPNDASRD